jgi:EmrB/QacA subfamily drug resistance transporter
MSSVLHASCDAAAAKAVSSSSPVQHPKFVLAATILASGLAFVDGSVVNVGLPSIQKSLHANASDLQWIVNAYLLPLSALLLFGGAAGDRFGRKLLLVCGIALFAASSVVCAAAPDLSWLLLGRTAQGIGAAILMPNSLAILGASFSGKARGRAIGIWAAMGAVVAAAGPVFGGWLIDEVGWRAIFLVNIPLAIAAILLALAFVREPRGKSEKQSLDFIGGFLVTLALGALTWALTVGAGHRGWTPTAEGALVAGIVLSIAFVWMENIRGERAMMPLALFGSSSFVGLSILTFLLYGALGGLLVLLPYVLIEAGGYSGTQAGAALLPFPIVLALTSPAMGALAGRTGPKLSLAIGPLIVAAGFLLLLRLDAKGNYWVDVLPGLFVIAIGMAGAVAPLTTAVLTSVDSRHTGSASGFNSAVARTGGLVATALLGNVLAATGTNIVGKFHFAAIVCAAVSIAASLSAFGLIKNNQA